MSFWIIFVLNLELFDHFIDMWILGLLGLVFISLI
uniref:Uncharacterized protein n=1 Tax=Rhizophora mucronata TaxID=61149 RepID=A0A2P2QB17_RHIMU